MNLKRCRVIPALLAACLCLTPLASCTAGSPEENSANSDASTSQPIEASSSYVQNNTQEGGYAASAGLPEEMRAMWISYLDLENVDISTEKKMRAVTGEMYDNCVALGLNTVIVAVRPFSDAMYPSELYPWSHLLTGEQGKDPGYDPLAVMLEEAHSRGLRFEAWLNPYRVDLPSLGPEELSENNPAVQNPEWVREANGVWYDPGLPEVQQLVTDGALEIVKNYDVDGIHLDDYFYPEFTAEQVSKGEDTAFDEKTYLKYGTGKELSTWRRQNVNTLVAALYEAAKTGNPNVSFGVSPQGNNENNFTMQYSDVKYWMANPGYVDYVIPQLYWGFGYLTSGGREDYAFGNISAEWASYPLHESVQLYAGIGAYRIGVGDGGANNQDEWKSGHNLADMVKTLRNTDNFSGFALFRYDFLLKSDNDYAPKEAAALATLLGGKMDIFKANTSAPDSGSESASASGGTSTKEDASSSSGGSGSSEGTT